MSTYKASKGTLLFHLSLLAFLTLVGLALTVQLLLQVPSRYPYNPLITAFMAVWGLLLLWSWYTYLTTPFEIFYDAGDSIEFLKRDLQRVSIADFYRVFATHEGEDELLHRILHVPALPASWHHHFEEMLGLPPGS